MRATGEPHQHANETSSMMETQAPEGEVGTADAAPRRPRGRPRLRDDAQTVEIILIAASQEFLAHGFGACNIASVAQKAGVSTKTLYRLIPTKEELFRRVVAARIGVFATAVNLRELTSLPLEEALVRLLTIYGELILGGDATGMYRLAIAERGRFPELARVFQETAIEPGGQAIEAWLRNQQECGAIGLGNLAEASGMLRGMMAMEGQRAALLMDLPPASRDEIVARAEACARLFLHGCLLIPTSTSRTGLILSG